METFHELNEYVKFYGIRIRNFLSVGEEMVSLNYTPGINVMRGVNYDEADSNGAGKSAILVDALLWCLFGKTLRKLPNANVINDGVKKGCSVSIKFKKGDISYTVTRSIPTKLRFEVAGKETDYPSVDQTQAAINEAINGDYEVYKNIITFHINKTKPFASSGADDKRKLWEYILNIIIYRQMAKLVHTAKTDADRDLLINSERLRSAESQLAAVKLSIGECEEQLAKFEEENNKKIKGWKNLIKESESKITPIDGIEEKLKKYKTAEEQANGMLEDVTERFEKARKVESQVNARIENFNLTRTKIKTLDVDSKCPTCNQLISSEHIDNCVKVLTDAIKPLQEGLKLAGEGASKYQEQANKIRDMIRQTTEKKRKISDTLQDNNAQESSIKTYKSAIEQIENDAGVKRIEKTLEKNRKVMIEHTGDFEALGKLVNTLKVQVDDYDLCKTLLSDSGIKEYVISIILPFVNNKLEEYMLRMNTSYTVRFGGDLSETFTKVSGNSQDRKYENFSEGEKKRIDLAMLLTFIDLAQLCGTINSNLLIFDELLDSSADSSGLESFMEILHDKAHSENLSIWIISHREQIGNIPIDREVVIGRKDDISYVEEGKLNYE